MFQSQSTNYLKLVCFIATALCLASPSIAQDPPAPPNVTIKVTAKCGSAEVSADGYGETADEACLDGQKKIKANNPNCGRLLFNVCPPLLVASPACRPVRCTVIYWCCEGNGQWTGFTESADSLSAAICKGKAKAQALGLVCCCTKIEIVSQPCQPKKKCLFRLFR